MEEKVKIEFTRLKADVFCTPIGLNKNGHVIYEVDMDDPSGPWRRVDEDDTMFSFKITTE